MKAIEKAPYWLEYFNPEVFRSAVNSPDLMELVKHADKEYVYWDKFKYYKPPSKISIQQAWAYLKFSRISNREYSPVKTPNGQRFSFVITKQMYQKLSFIDSNTSGFIRSEWKKPTVHQRSSLIISGLSEEAIASSQIEGAATSRKVAKDMILSQRKPRSRDEQMIVNNYQVMQRLQDWKDFDLTLDMLKDMQKNITINTLEDPGDSGRLRNDGDNIVVSNKLTGEVVFTPPPSAFVKEELRRLIEFANKNEDEIDFMHPVIKANILHFWLAYLHPFVDGNGRTARALFYWHLLRNNYWMFQYLSVSRVIKTSKARYDNSFIYSELDENDLSYFLSYLMGVLTQSVIDFSNHYKIKSEEDKLTFQLSAIFKDLNERQIKLLQYVNEHRNAIVTIKTHQNVHQVTYQTARTDVIGLADKGFFTQVVNGKRYDYVPNLALVKKAFSSVKPHIS
jgi:Fic family protein